MLAFDENETTGEDTEILEILGHRFSIATAPDDFNADKKTLFATMVWNGSKVLAQFILENCDLYIRGKRVIEFGAGAGLPSLCALQSGASFMCLTDYPSASVLTTLRKNLQANAESTDLVSKSLVVGHKWGEDVRDLVVGSTLYDVVLAAECLWKHDCHQIFLQSIAACLKPGGIVLLTFSHHIPGLEADDLNFFVTARSFGFEVIEATSVPSAHMWSEKTVDIYIYRMRLTNIQISGAES